MPFTYRDRPKLSERLLGRSGEDIMNEMKCDLDNERRMFFDSPWRSRANNSGFPRGFLFDDHPSRTNVRSYLDNLASRHPELADQLKEPPWSEDFGNPSFGGNRRTPNPAGTSKNQSRVPGEGPEGRHQNLNNFGLRNTVPLGQNANPEEQRRQRSMSAPPENRNSDRSKRFVSKCEIPIMHVPEDMGRASPSPKTMQEQTQAKTGNASNVRVIPIKVEGRDEPIINTGVDVAANFGGDKAQPSFDARLPRDFGSYQKHSPRFAHKARGPTPQAQSQPEPQPKAQCLSQSEPVPMPMPMPGPPPPPPPTEEVDSKPPEVGKVEVPKDPLTKVERIQKEVDQLKQEVEAYEGKSRTDKQFMMLDEMLTRKLISLDDIDTEGKDDVRQARKDTIRSIQRCISLLESRVPPVDNNDANNSKVENSNDSTALVPVPPMEVETTNDKSGGVDALQVEEAKKDGGASEEAVSRLPVTGKEE